MTNHFLSGLQLGDHHGNGCRSLTESTTAHWLGLDFLKEDDSSLALTSFISKGLFWQLCNSRGNLDSLLALLPVFFARKDNLPFRVSCVRRGYPARSVHPAPDLRPGGNWEAETFLCWLITLWYHTLTKIFLSFTRVTLAKQTSP